ncbi:MAG TPA: hypothetical protein VFN89_11775 [Solirubrobacterales bacterium]|nr:hypothetical protein [Solirubrobacterales bacterium]
MRGQAFVAGAAVVLSTIFLAACGGESSSDSNERSGSYAVEVTNAEFPSHQHLGETTLLRLDVRNTSHRTLPTLTVTMSVGGPEGRKSALPFGYRDPAAGIAQPDRPVWALAAGYPKVNGSDEPGGGETAEAKTFAFGPLKPGATTEAVWKLSAVKAGSYKLFYEVGAGLTSETKAKTANGAEAGGSFAVEVSDVPPEVEVKDNGEVVEIGKADSGK